MKKLLANCILGLLIIGLGVFILLQPNAFLKTLVLVFGLYILIEGLTSIIYSFKLKSMRNVFRISLVKSLLNFAVGILVVYFTFTAKGTQVTTWVVYLIAAQLLLSGLLTMLDTYFLKKLEVTGLGYYLGSDIIVSLVFAVLLFLFPVFIGSAVITILGVIVLLVGAGIFSSGLIFYAKVRQVMKDTKADTSTIEGEFTEIK